MAELEAQFCQCRIREYTVDARSQTEFSNNVYLMPNAWMQCRNRTVQTSDVTSGTFRSRQRDPTYCKVTVFDIYCMIRRYISDHYLCLCYGGES
jgi:hypothetical protein